MKPATLALFACLASCAAAPALAQAVDFHADVLVSYQQRGWS